MAKIKQQKGRILQAKNELALYKRNFQIGSIIIGVIYGFFAFKKSNNIIRPRSTGFIYKLGRISYQYTKQYLRSRLSAYLVHLK